MDTARVVDADITTSAVAEIWHLAGLPAYEADRLKLDLGARALPSSFRVAEATIASMAASGLAAAQLVNLCTGISQNVSVNSRHAEVSFLGEDHLRVDGAPQADVWGPVAGNYKCGDGRWVRIHANYPHHEAGVLELLNVPCTREAVEVALQNWNAEAFEQACAERGLVVFMMRSIAEWSAHDQGKALAMLPLFDLEQIGEAPPEALPGNGKHALNGVRILDLTRVIAGPVCGRTLAAHGAVVMRVSSPTLPPDATMLEIDGGRGKRSAFIDLKTGEGRESLLELVSEADVLVQGYRPGALDALGLSPNELTARRPGLVTVSLSAWGHKGPWAKRRGFDSLVQTASGINDEEGKAAGINGPKPLPCQALDHCTGYLMAFATMAALHKRATVGGSWHVRAALARTGRWLQSLGRIENGFGFDAPETGSLVDLTCDVPSKYGHLKVVRHPVRLSETPVREAPPEPYPRDAPEKLNHAAWL